MTYQLMEAIADLSSNESCGGNGKQTSWTEDIRKCNGYHQKTKGELTLYKAETFQNDTLNKVHMKTISRTANYISLIRNW
jgi:hypothetical protein